MSDSLTDLYQEETKIAQKYIDKAERLQARATDTELSYLEVRISFFTSMIVIALTLFLVGAKLINTPSVLPLLARNSITLGYILVFSACITALIAFANSISSWFKLRRLKMTRVDILAEHADSMTDISEEKLEKLQEIETKLEKDENATEI